MKLSNNIIFHYFRKMSFKIKVQGRDKKLNF